MVKSPDCFQYRHLTENDKALRIKKSLATINYLDTA